jgi:hypothetical protein
MRCPACVVNVALLYRHVHNDEDDKRPYYIAFGSRDALPSGGHLIAHPSFSSLGWASFSKRRFKLQGSPTSPSPRDRLAVGFFLMSLFWGGGMIHTRAFSVSRSRIYRSDSSVGSNSIGLLIRLTSRWPVALACHPLAWRSFLRLIPSFLMGRVTFCLRYSRAQTF